MFYNKSTESHPSELLVFLAHDMLQEKRLMKVSNVMLEESMIQFVIVALA